MEAQPISLLCVLSNHICLSQPCLLRHAHDISVAGNNIISFEMKRVDTIVPESV